jgi:hypothetical protein
MRDKEKIRQLVKDVLDRLNLKCEGVSIQPPLAGRPGLVWPVTLECERYAGVNIEVSERGTDENIREEIERQLSTQI